MRRVLALALAATVLVAVAAFPPPAVAAPVIQPGASIVTDGSYCTLNWVYDEVLTEEEREQREPRVLVGTAGHCVDRVGQEVSLSSGTFGDPVLAAFGQVAHLDDDLDYALVEVRRDHHTSVDPALKGHPTIPTGVSTRATARLGDTMQFSGHGIGFHADETTQQQRQGLLNYNDGAQHYVTGPVTNGDSGGPVANVTDGGKAFGIVTTLGAGANSRAMTIVTAGEGGVSLEGLLADAATHGWDLEVRTVGE